MKSQQEIIEREDIFPWFKENGYKKQGKNFSKPMNEYSICFNIQAHSFNSVDNVRFTFNTGIFLPTVHEVIYNSKSKFPKEYECLERKRIGQIKGQNDLWYELNSKANFEQVRETIINDLDLSLKPYLIGLENLDLVERYLNMDIRLYHPDYLLVAVFLFLNSHKERAQEMIINYYKEIKNQPVQNVINRFEIKI
jgi:hypothetical protein